MNEKIGALGVLLKSGGDMVKSLTFSLVFVCAACSTGALDVSTVNQQALAGSELMKRCQTSVQKASSQCGGDQAAACKGNVQEAQTDCGGAQSIFDTLAQITAASNK